MRTNGEMSAERRVAWSPARILTMIKFSHFRHMGTRDKIKIALVQLCEKKLGERLLIFILESFVFLWFLSRSPRVKIFHAILCAFFMREWIVTLALQEEHALNVLNSFKVYYIDYVGYYMFITSFSIDLCLALNPLNWIWLKITLILKFIEYRKDNLRAPNFKLLRRIPILTSAQLLTSWKHPHRLQFLLRK